MKSTRVAILMVLSALLSGTAVHFFGPKRVTKAASEVIDPDARDLAYAEKNRNQLAGESVWLVGRIYTDGGGYHWLVDAMGDEPYKTYALQLSAWPFRSDPPLGTWSRTVQVFGRFEEGDQKSRCDFMIGPSKILLPKGLSRPGEPIAPWVEDAEQAGASDGVKPSN